MARVANSRAERVGHSHIGRRVGAACTVGTNAFIHYGVTMGDSAALDTDAFLMKGEQITPTRTVAAQPGPRNSGRGSVGPTTVTHAITAAPATTAAPPLSGGSAAPLLAVIPRGWIDE